MTWSATPLGLVPEGTGQSESLPMGALIDKDRYATVGDVDIAYQVIGDGPIDILLWTGFPIPIDCMDEEPSMARFQRRLASFGRLIRFDPPRTSLAGSGSPSAPTTWEQQAQVALFCAPYGPTRKVRGSASYPELWRSPSRSEDWHPEWIYGAGDPSRCSHRLGGGYTNLAIVADTQQRVQPANTSRTLWNVPFFAFAAVSARRMPHTRKQPML
jgi:hypothetical protein